jgi:hypothetical protein
MGCEPGGFGWSATVEVCSARVTRLVTAQEKSKKFSATQMVPGTGRVDKICQHSDSGLQRCLALGWGGWFASIQAGRSRCLAPGAWTRFASIPILGTQRCLTPSWDVLGTQRCLTPSCWVRKGA